MMRTLDRKRRTCKNTDEHELRPDPMISASKTTPHALITLLVQPDNNFVSRSNKKNTTLVECPCVTTVQKLKSHTLIKAFVIRICTNDCDATVITLNLLASDDYHIALFTFLSFPRIKMPIKIAYLCLCSLCRPVKIAYLCLCSLC
jgi:hypothetical protein